MDTRSISRTKHKYPPLPAGSSVTYDTFCCARFRSRVSATLQSICRIGRSGM